MNNEGEFGKYILQDLILPPTLAAPEEVADYREVGPPRHRWLDARNMPCQFQMNTCWIVHPDRLLQIEREEKGTSQKSQPHAHEADELVGFLGSNPDDPSDLCGEIEFHIEDEVHILAKSSYIFLPAGTRHVHKYINRVDRPILHFSFLLSPEYSLERKDGQIVRAN
jgi:hypothetical protein